MQPADPPVPLALPRQLLRRSAAMLAAVLLLALALGLWRVGRDVHDEMAAAQALAQVSAHLATLAMRDDDAVLASTRELLQHSPLRHLRIELRDGSGQLRLASAPSAAGVPPALLALYHRLAGPNEVRPVQWSLPRPQGPAWTVQLHPSRDSESAEAMAGLLASLAQLLLAAAGMLLVMRWSLGRAFAPLQPMLLAIGRIEQGDPSAVAALPRMPVHELERVAQALRHLGRSLAAAESDRRTLGRRVLTLQEDERARLARELHDEFGQHLTALRVDAAWLQRRLQGDDLALQVLQSLAGHGQRIHDELRSVLARLRPLQGLDPGAPVPPSALHDLLQSLRQGWQSSPGAPLQVDLALTGWLAGDGGPQVPAPLALALYRITQESLSNAARHADARRVQVRLHGGGSARAPYIDWSVADDGRGLRDVPLAQLRGSGIAGSRERVWALGGELVIADADAARPHGRPGLRLSARLAAGLAAGAAVQ